MGPLTLILAIEANYASEIRCTHSRSDAYSLTAEPPKFSVQTVELLEHPCPGPHPGCFLIDCIRTTLFIT